MDTKDRLLASISALFLLGLVIWALGSEVTAAIGAVLGVALALFVAFIALVYIAAVGARRAQAVEDAALRDLWSDRTSHCQTSAGKPQNSDNDEPRRRTHSAPS